VIVPHAVAARCDGAVTVARDGLADEPQAGAPPAGKHEPRLHVHAVRAGRPLRLRFAGVRGTLRRGRVASVASHEPT